MPTILRFGPYRVMIFTQDHEPSHVHVLGNGAEYVFTLHCPGGPVNLRRRYNGSEREERKIMLVLTTTSQCSVAHGKNCMADDSEYKLAGKRMAEMRKTVPYAVAARYDSKLHRVFVTLNNHLEIAINPEQTQTLQGKPTSALKA